MAMEVTSLQIDDEQPDNAPANHTATVFYGLSRQVFAYLPSVLTPGNIYFEGPWEDGPNDNFSQANGPPRFGRTYFGYPNEKGDWYSVMLEGTSNLSIALDKHNSRDTQFQLWRDISGEPIAFDADLPCRFEASNLELDEYFVAILTENNNNLKVYELRAII
jgi:hypothetical protein